MGLTFNITYDSSVNNAPAAFKAAVAAAAQAYQNLFSDPITINIQVGYGEIDGQSLGGALGESMSYQSGYSSTEVKNALAADATSSIDQSAVANLASANPSALYLTTTAEAKALGLMGPSNAVDGYVGFSSSLPFSYNSNHQTTAGSFDFVGTVEHEFSEIMGRISEVSTSIGNTLSVLDLFRYSAPNARQLIGGQPSYFSVDGGRTSLDAFNTDASGDFGDWAASAGNDAFLAFSGPGVSNGLSQADVAVMDALGYDAVAAASPPPVPAPLPAAMTVANALAAYAANPQMAAISISDTAANVNAGLDALQSLASASKLTAVALIGSNGLAVSAGQLQNDAAVLAAITSNYSMTVSGVSAGAALATAAVPHVTSISLADNGANVGANLDGLQTLAASGKLSSIILTDGVAPTLMLTAAQFKADANALSKIASVFALAINAVPANLAASIAAQPHVTTIAVSDSAANVSANLSGLQTLAANGKLSSIALTGAGTPSLSITAAQFAADAAALHAISTPFALSVTGLTVASAGTVLGNPLVTSITVSDSVANISAGLDTLQQWASQHQLTSINMTAPQASPSFYYYIYAATPVVPTLAVTAAQLSLDGAAIAAITSNYSMTVSGVSAGAALATAAVPHVTSISLADNGANVGANLDGLQTLAASGKLSSIILTDGVAPTLMLTAAQFKADANALSKIASVFALAINAVPANLAASIAAQPHVTTIAVSDSAANVSANLSGLQTLAANGKLSSIALTGAGTPSLSITAAQFAADAAALHAISTPFALSVTGLTVASAGAVLGNPLVTSITVSDSVANISAGLDTLQQWASQHQLTSINMTAPQASPSFYYYIYAATPVVPTLAVTAAQLSLDGAAIAAITSNYSMTVSGVSAGAALATAAVPHVTSISLADNGANVGANLDALQTLAASGKLSSIILTDGVAPTLMLTAAQFKADANALSKIASVFALAINAVPANLAASIAAQPHVTTIAVSDSAANVSANLSGLQTLAANGKLSSIALTGAGTPSLSITAAQFAADAAALHAISTPFALSVTGLTVASAGTVLGNPLVTSITVSDSVANISAGLDTLQQWASQHQLTSINMTAPQASPSFYYYIYAATPVVPTLAVTAAQLSLDGAAIAAITSNYSMTVSGVSAGAALATAAVPHVTSISLADNGANVGANLDGLQTLAASGKLSSIILTDGVAPTLMLTAAQFKADANALSKIASVFALAINAVPANLAASIAAQPHVTTIAVSDSAANVSANLSGLQTLAANGKLSSIALTGAGTPSLSITAAQFAADAAALHAISTPFALSVTGLTVASAGAVLGNPLVTSITVSDSVANISAGLDTLQQWASQHQLTSINMTAPQASPSFYYYIYAATPVVPTLAVTAAQLSLDGAAIAAITSNYSMTVSGVSAGAALATAAVPHVTSISLADNGANVGANLDVLQTLAASGKLSSIILTDGVAPTLMLTAAQFKADANALSKIASVFALAINAVPANLAASIAAQPHVTAIAVSDSAANVSANLSGLQTLAANGKLSSIALTDAGSPTFKLTALQQQADAAALSDIVTPFTVQIITASSTVVNFINAVSSLAPAPSAAATFYQAPNPQTNGVSTLSAHPLA